MIFSSVALPIYATVASIQVTAFSARSISHSANRVASSAPLGCRPIHTFSSSSRPPSVNTGSIKPLLSSTAKSASGGVYVRNASLLRSAGSVHGAHGVLSAHSEHSGSNQELNYSKEIRSIHGSNSTIAETTASNIESFESMNKKDVQLAEFMEVDGRHISFQSASGTTTFLFVRGK